ncbi:hypothetical protein CBL_03086 [Carabus blaptoides fortunei]
MNDKRWMENDNWSSMCNGTQDKNNRPEEQNLGCAGQAADQPASQATRGGPHPRLQCDVCKDRKLPLPPPPADVRTGKGRTRRIGDGALARPGCCRRASSLQRCCDPSVEIWTSHRDHLIHPSNRQTNNPNPCTSSKPSTSYLTFGLVFQAWNSVNVLW